ncbi:MAG: hypothetical protein U1A24_21380 [Cypionkella sp.]|nr:hypothetical protein [Cypionkella sp.]MDZ4313102.1 hypothetical protein [Cypionkella sp.]
MLLATSFLAALIGLGFAGAAAVLPDTGIDATIGAFLAVLGAFAVTLALGVIVAKKGKFKARGVLLRIAAIVSILTAIAAWFLMQDAVLAAMVVSLLALLASGAAAERKVIP